MLLSSFPPQIQFFGKKYPIKRGVNLQAKKQLVFHAREQCIIWGRKGDIVICIGHQSCVNDQMKQLTMDLLEDHSDPMTNDQKTQPERVSKKPSAEEVKATIKRTAKDMKDVLVRLADK